MCDYYKFTCSGLMV